MYKTGGKPYKISKKCKNVKKPRENRLIYRKKVKKVLNGKKNVKNIEKKGQNIEKPGKNRKIYRKNVNNFEKLAKTAKNNEKT